MDLPGDIDALVRGLVRDVQTVLAELEQAKARPVQLISELLVRIVNKHEIIQFVALLYRGSVGGLTKDLNSVLHEKSAVVRVCAFIA
jgi:hypothetical protein